MIKRCCLTSIGNLIVEIRRSYDRLISTIGFPIPVRRHLFIESGPRSLRLKHSEDHLLKWRIHNPMDTNSLCCIRLSVCVVQWLYICILEFISTRPMSCYCVGVGEAVRFLVVGTIGKEDKRGQKIWLRSDTGLSSTQFEEIPIVVGIWLFFLVYNILVGLWWNWRIIRAYLGERRMRHNLLDLPVPSPHRLHEMP